MHEFGVVADGGKDSLSMVAKHNDTLIKSPGSLVLTMYAACPDVTVKVTPLVDTTPQSDNNCTLLICPMATSPLEALLACETGTPMRLPGYGVVLSSKLSTLSFKTPFAQAPLSQDTIKAMVVYYNFTRNVVL